jgi:Arylsulfotransferase (ASST)
MSRGPAIIRNPVLTETSARRIFIASIAFLLLAGAFAYGWAVQAFRIWPYQLIDAGRDAVESYREFGRIVPHGLLVKAPAGASGKGYVVHDRSRMLDGSYVFVGFDARSSLYKAWLYKDGKALHSWTVDYARLDPDAAVDHDANPHGFVALPDGSLVVNWDKGQLMARLDACSKPVWIKRGAFHHSVSLADDGSLWTWRGEGDAYAQDQSLVRLDGATGTTIREISLLDDVIARAGPLAKVFGVRPDYPFVRTDKVAGRRKIPDIFHPNDLEALSAELAPRFPMFEAGDLLVSVREPNLVAVLDADDLRLKWWSNGPWRGQHDPDFESNGKISVFDNNTGRDRSEIIRIDVATGTISNNFFGGEVRFYSAYMGTHQSLPNGNVLVVVPGEGRIFEATNTGQYVMEFNNSVEELPGYNAHVENAAWLPPGYFATGPTCSH